MGPQIHKRSRFQEEELRGRRKSFREAKIHTLRAFHHKLKHIDRAAASRGESLEGTQLREKEEIGRIDHRSCNKTQKKNHANADDDGYGGIVTKKKRESLLLQWLRGREDQSKCCNLAQCGLARSLRAAMAPTRASSNPPSLNPQGKEEP